LFGVVDNRHLLYATIANDMRTFADGECGTRHDRVMFRKRIVHQLRYGFDGFTETNMIRPGVEDDAEICFPNFVFDSNSPSLIWIADHYMGPVRSSGGYQDWWSGTSAFRRWKKGNFYRDMRPSCHGGVDAERLGDKLRPLQAAGSFIA
jgi:hypothetical protein